MNNKKPINTLKWAPRILSLLILLFALPFYFGYGNPLPFAKSDYSWSENLWLTLFPVIFIGLAIGWKYPKIGGLMITISILLGLILGFTADAEFSGTLLIVLIPGVLYLINGYKK